MPTEEPMNAPEAHADDEARPERAERPERPERAQTASPPAAERERGPERAERADKAERPERERPARQTVDPADRDDRSLRERLEGLVPDIVRKTFYAGLGAVFTTEEGIRKLTSDFSLPKDVAGYLLNQADGAKDEVLRIVGREMHEFFERVNLSQELAKVLTQLSFEIKTEIRFIPNDEAVGGLGVKPDIKRKVGIKRNRDSHDDEPDAD
jgi:hypothetical protein